MIKVVSASRYLMGFEILDSDAGDASSRQTLATFRFSVVFSEGEWVDSTIVWLVYGQFKAQLTWPSSVAQVWATRVGHFVDDAGRERSALLSKGI